VTINLRAEKPILLRVFAKSCLNEERDYDTIRKWWKHGLLNRATGKKVRLEVIRLSNGMHTSMEAYDRFLMRLNGSSRIKPGESA
jgi:hypothetical protein